MESRWILTTEYLISDIFFSLQIIDPYVKLDFHGIQADTASFKTKVVKDNGNKQFLSTLLQNYDFMMRSLIGWHEKYFMRSGRVIE